MSFLRMLLMLSYYNVFNAKPSMRFSRNDSTFRKCKLIHWRCKVVSSSYCKFATLDSISTFIFQQQKGDYDWFEDIRLLESVFCTQNRIFLLRVHIIKIHKAREVTAATILRRTYYKKKNKLVKTMKSNIISYVSGYVTNGFC